MRLMGNVIKRFPHCRDFLLAALFPALLMSAINALKPVHIDDTIYLTYANQILQHPSDPYGFEMFWFQRPESANHVLCPAGVPYWIALGMAIFGQNIPLLKFWMFPFALLLLAGLRRIMVHCRIPHRTSLLWMTAFSPAVLPGFNLMLDVPYFALLVGAVAVMLDGSSRRGFVLAGVLCGLSIWCKWTGFIGLPLLGIIAWQQKRQWQGIAAILIAIAMTAAWEGWIAWRYGQSHLLFQIFIGDGNREPSRWPILMAMIPLFGAAGGILLPLRWANRRIFWLLLPIPLAAWFMVYQMEWQLAGMWIAGISSVAAVGCALWNQKTEPRSSAESLLPGWLILEMVACILLSPFAAMRRVLGMVVVGTLIVGRSLDDEPATRLKVRIAAGSFAALGLFVNYVDILEARGQRQGVADAVAAIRSEDPQARIYYHAHWGFQHYAEQAGAHVLLLDETILQPGDWVMLDTVTGGDDILLPSRPTRHLVIRDLMSLSTIPYYTSALPLGRKAARLDVFLFRIDQPQRWFQNNLPIDVVETLEKRYPNFSNHHAYALIKAMRFGDPPIANRAADLLLKMGIPALEAAKYYSDDPRIQQWAEYVLSHDD